MNMHFNPFEEKPIPLDKTLEPWAALYPKPYNKHEVDPYSKTRVILMNGTEFEAVWFSHQFFRHCDNCDLRRDLALLRRGEQGQQKRIAALKPIDEPILETTISYEQLAVDLTAFLAKREPDPYVKATLDFALLEDFDHLYRYADLLEQDSGILAEKLVGNYTEIMPGRPTISEHRYPYDNVRKHVNFQPADPLTKLHVGIITAAEQQTMNYYMNVAGFYQNDIGRQLYQEIGLIEEQHVSQYGSLLDTTCTWLENLLMHEYTECYLYYSCYHHETHPELKKVWEQHLYQEIAHLHKAAELLQTYDKKEWQQVIPGGAFPDMLKLESNKDYVREILAGTVQNTADKEEIREVSALPKDHEFFYFQQLVNTPEGEVPSHRIINQYIGKNGTDYRYEDSPNPIEALRDRTSDNTRVGRS